MKLQVASLGQLDYLEALALQNSLLELRQQNAIADTLLILEHPATITIGVRGKNENILIPEEMLKQQGVNIIRVRRGGDVTYHGPGQIVGYPILDLNKHGRDIHDFVHRIEGSIIDLLQEHYGITAGRDAKYTGVWVGNEKITAIGCAVKRWVTMHGFAFNVNTDLEHFKWITPCGIRDRGVTSLQKILGYPLDLARVNEQVITHFCERFKLQPEKIDRGTLSKIIRGE